MAWTNPTTRATGELITSSIWNTDLVNNLAYLKLSPTFDGDVTVTSLLIVNGQGTAASPHKFTTSTAGRQEVSIIQQTSGTTGLASLKLTAGTATGFLQLFSQGFTSAGSAQANAVRLFATDAGGLYIEANSGPIQFWANGSQRWGINTAGDHTFGASSNIADSSGTPTILSGFGTGPSIAGRDYAFLVTLGTGSPTSGVVTFGHTWTNAPACTATPGAGFTGTNLSAQGATTTLTIAWTTGATGVINVHCRGY